MHSISRSIYYDYSYYSNSFYLCILFFFPTYQYFNLNSPFNYLQSVYTSSSFYNPFYLTMQWVCLYSIILHVATISFPLVVFYSPTFLHAYLKTFHMPRQILQAYFKRSMNQHSMKHGITIVELLPNHFCY